VTTAADERQGPAYVLQLYVTGMSPRSSRAIENILEICEHYLSGRYDLQVVDLYQNPVAASTEQIVAAPTLVKRLPLPLRRVVGDMSNETRVLVGLDLHGNH
jgi:circadian clock protein KaiB